MNKWLIALLSAIIVLIAIAIELYFSPIITNILKPHPSVPPEINESILHIPSDNYRDSDGLTVKEKMDAITIALNDSTIRDTMKRTNDYSVIYVGNVTSLNASKERGIDSGFLNTSLKIAYVTVTFRGMPMSLMLDDYVVYVDVLNNKTLGIVTYRGKAGPIAYVTIPPGSIWYTQVYGSSLVGPENNLEMAPTLAINIDDVNTISPIILSKDNFEKFKNGSPYIALKYKDFVTNASCIADGSQPINIIATTNGTAIWRANVSFYYPLPADANEFFPNFYYHVLVENKNKDKEINIKYWN